MESFSVLFDCKTTGKSTRCARSDPPGFARRAARREMDWIHFKVWSDLGRSDIKHPRVLRSSRIPFAARTGFALR